MSSGNDLHFQIPIKKTTEEVIVALKNEDLIEHLCYDFNDEQLESSTVLSFEFTLIPIMHIYELSYRCMFSHTYI